MTKIEVWKPIPEFKNYHISNFANVKNVKFGTFLNPSLQKGYKRLQLYNGKTRKKFYLHRLVAMVFIPNPLNLPTVDHIDMDNTNNEVYNLRWASYKQQSENKHPCEPIRNTLKRPIWMCDISTFEKIHLFRSTNVAAEYVRNLGDIKGRFRTTMNRIRNAANKSESAYGFKWKFEEYETIEGEIWKPVSSEVVKDPKDFVEGYYISDNGRLKCPNNEIRIPYMSPDGYPVIGMMKKTFFIHRVIALTFIDNILGKNMVNHKNGDKKDYSLSNLEFVTCKENIDHAIETGLTKTKGVDQYCLNGIYIRSHNSIASAGRYVNLSPCSIIRVLKNNKPYGGYQWRLSEDNVKSVDAVDPNSSNKRKRP